jgi:hypothetical protein
MKLLNNSVSSSGENFFHFKTFEFSFFIFQTKQTNNSSDLAALLQKYFFEPGDFKMYNYNTSVVEV